MAMLSSEDAFSHKKKWRLKTLLLLHLLVAILLSTLFWPLTNGFWAAIDVFFFKTINGTLEGHPYRQIFWAFANHRNADWVEDFCIFIFFVLHVRSAQKAMRPRKIAELVFLVLYAAFLIFFINRVIFKQSISITRESPTLVVDASVRLSEELPWLKIKDDSSKSFPGDHGTTALLFAAGFSYFAGRRLAWAACLYAAFLCIPRMIVGAHWLTDVVIGSGSIAMIFLGWAFCTPFASWCIDKIEGFLLAAKSLFIKKTPTSE
jgi:Kdo2-lipid A phosphotransferase